MSEEGCFAALVRHGTFAQPVDVPSAHLPYGLIDDGRAEALRGARALSAFALEHSLQIDPVIDCSRLRRAWETAEIIRQVLQQRSSQTCTIAEFDELVERSLGAAANLTTREIERIVESDPRHTPLPIGWKRNSENVIPFPGAESLLAAGKRVAQHLERRISLQNTRTLKIFVGHGGAFRHAAHLLGVLRADEVATLSMYCGETVTLRRDAQGWTHFAGRWKPRKGQAPLADEAGRP